MGKTYIESREHSLELEVDRTLSVHDGILYIDGVAVTGLIGKVRIFWEVDLSNSSPTTVRGHTGNVIGVGARGHTGNVIGVGARGHTGNVTAVATGGNAAVAVGFNGDIDVVASGGDATVAVGFDGDISVAAVGGSATAAIGFNGGISVTASGGKIARIGHGDIVVGRVAENTTIGHGKIDVAISKSDSSTEEQLPASNVKGLLAD